MSDGIEFSGFDGLEKNLKKIQKKAEKLSEKQEVSFDVLFNKEFMIKHTSFEDFDMFLKNGGFEVNNQQDFENIPENELDSYIEKETKFDNWQQMLDESAGEYFNKQLFE